MESYIGNSEPGELAIRFANFEVRFKAHFSIHYHHNMCNFYRDIWNNWGQIFLIKSPVLFRKILIAFSRAPVNLLSLALHEIIDSIPSLLRVML